MLKIVTDSTADLTPALIRRFDLTVIPLYVRFGEEVYRDGIDLTPESFLRKLETAKDFPRTAGPTPGEFETVFRRLLDEGHEVLYVGLSSDLSATYGAAEMARAQLTGAPVDLLDSRNLSMGIGLLAIKAARLAREGLARHEVLEACRRLVPRIKTAFIVDKLDYLHKGGRLSALQTVVGNILKIHPIVSVQDGRLTLAEKARGDRARALERILSFCLPDPTLAEPEMISVTHCGCEKDAEILASRVRELAPGAGVVVTKAGSVISSHCGPPTVGILYIAKA